MTLPGERQIGGFQCRPYRSLQDFQAMVAILQEGRRLRTGCYYVHPGDLGWWMFYNEPQENARENVILWENTAGETNGWTLLSPHFNTFDVFLQPSLYGSKAAAEIIAWSAARMARFVREAGGRAIRTLWISEGDEVTKSVLHRLGFRQTDSFFLVMERSLEQFSPVPAQVPGFRLRNLSGEAEVNQRAAVSYATFGSQMPFDQYRQRYLNFMRSPVYHADLDLVAEGPQGELAAFCIAWLDDENRLGHFEPVGVHPDRRRKGLGKAMLEFGMRRMQAGNMSTAMVCAEGENQPAVRLYASAGFKVVDRLFTYERGV